MTTTPYRRGSDFERKVAAHLYAQGAKLVVRSAGSHSPVDLVALYGPGGWWLDREGNRTHAVGGTERTPWLVQVKKDGKLYGKARKDFIALARSVGAEAVLAKAVKNGRRVDVVLEVLS